MEVTIITLIEKGRYKIDEHLAKQGDTINVFKVVKEVYANMRRGRPCNILNLITTEQVSVPLDPKFYSMIDQLKNTLAKISLYDLISTSQVHSLKR